MFLYCSQCNSNQFTKVVDSRDNGVYIRRRRKCCTCGHRFTTKEKLEGADPINKGKLREAFNFVFDNLQQLDDSEYFKLVNAVWPGRGTNHE